MRSTKWLGHLTKRLVKWLALLVLPSLIDALRKHYYANRSGESAEGGTRDEQLDEKWDTFLGQLKDAWPRHLDEGSSGEQVCGDRTAQSDRVINILLSIIQSDENRAYAVASKARGVLQTVGFVVAGNIAALTLALRDEASYFLFTAILSSLSTFYLVCTVISYLLADHPRLWHVMDPNDALKPDEFGPRLLTVIHRNRDLSIYRTNFTVSAIRDVVRSLVAVVVAVIVAIPTV